MSILIGVLIGVPVGIVFVLELRKTLIVAKKLLELEAWFEQTD